MSSESPVTTAQQHGKPHDANGEDGLQLWRLDVNILNKQSLSGDIGWSYSLRVGVGLTVPHSRQ
jgi:hypothetical protein